MQVTLSMYIHYSRVLHTQAGAESKDLGVNHKNAHCTQLHMRNVQNYHVHVPGSSAVSAVYSMYGA